MRLSSAGPGFLARIPRPQPVSSSSYMMSRHLHYVLFNACEDAETSLQGTAECVRRNGKSVLQALKYLMWGPTAEERESAVGKSGLFAGRMFQRYLKADPYLIGEDWPRSVLRFPDHEHEKTHSFAITMQKAEVTGPCSHFSIAHGTALDAGAATPSWVPIKGSSSASVVDEQQCCALCVYHQQCQAWQLTEPGFCRLLMPTAASRGRIPLAHDQYSQVGLLIGPPASHRASSSRDASSRAGSGGGAPSNSADSAAASAGEGDGGNSVRGDGGGGNDGGDGGARGGARSTGGDSPAPRQGTGADGFPGGQEEARDSSGVAGASAGGVDQGTLGVSGGDVVTAGGGEGAAGSQGDSDGEGDDQGCLWVQSVGNAADQEHAGFAHSRQECVALVTERCPDASMARWVVSSFLPRHSSLPPPPSSLSGSLEVPPVAVVHSEFDASSG